MNSLSVRLLAALVFIGLAVGTMEEPAPQVIEPEITREMVLSECSNYLNMRPVILENVQTHPGTVQKHLHNMMKLDRGPITSEDPLYLVVDYIQLAGSELDLYLATGKMKHYIKGATYYQQGNDLYRQMRGLAPQN